MSNQLSYQKNLRHIGVAIDQLNRKLDKAIYMLNIHLQAMDDREEGEDLGTQDSYSDEMEEDSEDREFVVPDGVVEADSEVMESESWEEDTSEIESDEY